ncbi:MAG: hypothetical protein ACHQNA_05890 [Acidimicrobiales bacterium]
MDGRLRMGRLLVGLTSVALLAGCAAGASPTVAPATLTPASPTLVVTPAATPITAPTPAMAPEALAYGPATSVTGATDCRTLDDGTVTTDPDGTIHTRAGTLECTDTVNDPRVSGTYTGSWGSDRWGNGPSHGALVQWGRVRLVNAGGAWNGRFAGSYSSDRGDTIVTWYTGTGGYAGLAYFEVLTGFGPWSIQGLIFPGSPPNP